MLTATHPYRSSPGLGRAALGFARSYRTERVAAEGLLLGWCLLRVTRCAADGVDADGILACLLTVAVALGLAASLRDAPDSPESTPSPGG